MRLSIIKDRIGSRCQPKLRVDIDVDGCKCEVGIDMGMGMGIERLDPDVGNGGATGTGRSGAQAQAPATNDKPALGHGDDRLEKNMGISTHQLAKDIHTATTHLQGCACD
jgi:hypothetical protein